MRGLSEVVGQIGPVGQQDRDAQIFSDSIRSHLTLNSLDWQGLVDRTDRTGKTGKTGKTSRTGKTRQTAWIDLTKNPIGPISPPNFQASLYWACPDPGIVWLALLLAQLDLPSEYRYPLWRYQQRTSTNSYFVARPTTAVARIDQSIRIFNV